ncbi:MAG: chromate transporter, partial [Clostridia bacterium]|nr:chromate transporter [Clostridia bacterium]
LDRFLEIKWVASAFRGIRIAVAILIIDAAVRMIGKTEKKPLPLIILSVSFIAMILIDVFALRVSTIVLMLAAAVAGLAVYLVKRHREKEEMK